MWGSNRSLGEGGIPIEFLGLIGDGRLWAAAGWSLGLWWAGLGEWAGGGGCMWMVAAPRSGGGGGSVDR